MKSRTFLPISALGAGIAGAITVEVIDAACHQDHVDLRKTRLQSGHQLEAIDFGHSDVDNRQGGEKFYGERDGVFRRARSTHVMRVAENPFHRSKNPRLIVDHENPRSRHDAWTCE